MRVLFVTNRFPGRLMRGDQVRAFEQLRALSARHEITLLSFAAPERDAEGESLLRACCARVVVAPRALPGVAWRAVCALGDDRPLQVAAFDAVPAAAALPTLLAGTRFDVAHVQLARLGPMLRRLAPVPCVVDLVDALSLNMTRRATLDAGPLGWIARIEARRLAAYERRLCGEAARVAISALPDRDAIGAPHLRQVPNGVDLERFPFVAGAGRRDLVFVGNLGYFPNVDAAAWFVDTVMPILRPRHPGLRLRLVGARPARRLRRIAAAFDDVDLVGEVPDVHPELARAAVAVIPLRCGSGQQLKMIEAMAAGTPVVSTSLSASGFDAVPGEDLLIADGCDAMADAVSALLGDRDRALRMAASARRHVERGYAWDASARALEQLWFEAAAAADEEAQRSGGGASS
jgi:glycosyltransferase involved in cell wall biosynthesis